MWRIFPLSVEPDWETLLDTITIISLGMLEGGFDEFPGLLVHDEPQVSPPV